MNYEEIKDDIEQFIRAATETFSCVEIIRPFHYASWNQRLDDSFCREKAKPVTYKDELVYPDLKIDVKEKPEALNFLFDIDIEQLSDESILEMNFNKDIATEEGSEYCEIQLFLSKESFLNFKYFIDLKFGYSNSCNWSASTSFHGRNNAAVELLLEKSKSDELKKFILLNIDLFHL